MDSHWRHIEGNICRHKIKNDSNDLIAFRVSQVKHWNRALISAMVVHWLCIGWANGKRCQTSKHNLTVSQTPILFHWFLWVISRLGSYVHIFVVRKQIFLTVYALRRPILSYSQLFSAILSHSELFSVTDRVFPEYKLLDCLKNPLEKIERKAISSFI